jgi:hypothetical protein
MYRIRLSRALLAALAVASLATGTTLVTSGAADASPRIDPGFGRGPPRIDPGFGNGPTKIDPGFGKNSGPQFTVAKGGHYRLRTDCHWIDRPGAPQPKHPGPGMGQNSGKVKVCY